MFDRATNASTVGFSVRRDAAVPSSTTASSNYENGITIPITWTALDSAAGDSAGLAQTLWGG